MNALERHVALVGVMGAGIILPLAMGLGWIKRWSSRPVLAATLVLVISFAALAVLWREPRLQEPRGRRVMAVPRAVEVACAD